MWKCPKCGRAFKHTNQSHYCGQAPATVDKYILAQNEAIRVQLQSVRMAIRRGLPDPVEKISWSMPAYWQGINILNFAAQIKHIGLYPDTEAVEQFAERLTEAGCSFSKGSIRIPYSDSLPLQLISDIAARRVCRRRRGKEVGVLQLYAYGIPHDLRKSPIPFIVQGAGVVRIGCEPIRDDAADVRKGRHDQEIFSPSMILDVNIGQSHTDIWASPAAPGADKDFIAPEV